MNAFLILTAAGLAAGAGWLAVAMARPARRASERGYTMQTLIITSVLALGAVAAGVVILAVATSGSEAVDAPLPGNSQCNEVEVFDGIKREAGEAGNAGGLVVGTGLGCIPACFWIDRNGDRMVQYVKADDGNRDELLFIRELPASGSITVEGVSIDASKVVGGVPTREGTIVAFATGNSIFTALVAEGENERPGTTSVGLREGISQVVINTQQTDCEGRS